MCNNQSSGSVLTDEILTGVAGLTGVPLKPVEQEEEEKEEEDDYPVYDNRVLSPAPPRSMF